MRRLSLLLLRRWAVLPLSIVLGVAAFRLSVNIMAATTPLDSFLWGLAMGGVVIGWALAGRALRNPELGFKTRGVRTGLVIGVGAALVAATVYLAQAPFDYPSGRLVPGFAVAALAGGYLFLPLLIRLGLAARLAPCPVRGLVTGLSVLGAVAASLHTAYLMALPGPVADKVLAGLLLASLLSALALLLAYVWGGWRRGAVDSEGQSG